MRAFMSDSSTRGLAIRVGVSLTSADFALHCAGRNAVAEVERILWSAELEGAVEAEACSHQSVIFMSARTLTHGTLLSAGQAALAETLAAFVEG